MPAVPSGGSSSTSGSPRANNGSSHPHGAAAAASEQPYTSSYRERQLPIRRSAKACVACRKAKARCDGPELWPCRRCREAGNECIFEGVPKEELGTKIAQATAGSDAGPHSLGSTPPWSTERRLLQLEQEIAVLRRTASEHEALFSKLETQQQQLQDQQQQQAHAAAFSVGGGGSNSKGKEKEMSEQRIQYEPTFAETPPLGNGLPTPMIPQQLPLHSSTLPANSTSSYLATSPLPTTSNASSSNGLSNGEHSSGLSIDQPGMDRLSRAAFDTFFNILSPWAPYIDPISDAYDAVRIRSPLLFYCILSVSTQFHPNSQWAQHCEQQALKYIRATVYSEIPTTLDDLKGTLLYNAWLSHGSPPGHSCTLAAQLELPRSLERLLSAMDKPDANKAFDDLMPSIRTWLSLYAQDLWLSVATGRRGLVTVDFSIVSARSLLKFEALRAVDARIVAQSELVTILGNVQENFIKIRQTSIAETVHIIQRADKHFGVWIQTWTEWAKMQEENTSQYMIASFMMQNHVGRFYINTLGLRDITSPEEVTPIQMPVIKAAIKAAYDVQIAAQGYGSHRMSSSTEMTLISCCSAALFLLKMIKLMPDEFRSGERDRQDITATLAAIRTTSKLLAGAPRQNYHLAVASALNHLESQFLSPSYALDTLADPMLSAGNSISSTSTPNQHDVLFDPELELAISSVIEESNFWSWSQAQPADSFSGLLS